MKPTPFVPIGIKGHPAVLPEDRFKAFLTGLLNLNRLQKLLARFFVDKAAKEGAVARPVSATAALPGEWVGTPINAGSATH